MDPREVLTRRVPSPDRTLAYGPGPDHVFDVRGAGPLVLFLHGGFWRAEYDRTHVGPLACALAEAGYTVAACEYRRTGQSGGGQPSGGWPGTFEDVRRAVERIPQVLGVELALIAGHSAGGHLALWAPVECPVLALAPVTGLVEAYELDLDGGAVGALLGGSPTEFPERYAAAEPQRRGTILHGLDDAQVPIELSRAYAARTGATLVELPGVEHFSLIDPLSDVWPIVEGHVRAAVEQAGRSELGHDSHL